MLKNKLVKLTGVAAAVAMTFSSMTVCAADTMYTTQRGDSLSKIAQKMYGDKARWRDIYEANKDVIKDPNLIWANQQLAIPDALAVEQQPQIQPQPQDMPSEWQVSEEWQAVAAANTDYVQQNGLQFYQGTTFKSLGYRYDEDYPDYFEILESNGSIIGITVRDAEREGYQVVTISNVRDGHAATHYWGEEVLNVVVVPSISLCDIYTGRVLPGANMVGDAELVNTTQLTWGGISYDIDYIKEVRWDFGEWPDWDEDGSSYSQYIANGTTTVTIPKGYDGLALLVIPVTEGPDPDEEYNVFDNETEEYIMDEWKDGSYLMRVSDLYNILN